MSVPRVGFVNVNASHYFTNLKKLTVLVIQKQSESELSQMLKESFVLENITCEIVICKSVKDVEMDLLSHIDFVIIVPSMSDQAFEEIVEEVEHIDVSFFHFTRICFVCLNLEKTRSAVNLLDSLQETYKDSFILPMPLNVTPFLIEGIKNYIINVLGMRNGKINILPRNMNTSLEKRKIETVDEHIITAIEYKLKNSE